REPFANLSCTFPPAFTHLSATFPVAETGVKRLNEKELQARRSENGRKHRYGEKQRRITEGGSL
ncbi:MAG: hypothetical protein WCL49_13265, partial [bacterium]